MDDSFDDELFGDSESSEVPIENNNSQEIDVKPNDKFDEAIRNILKRVMTMTNFTEMDVKVFCDAVAQQCELNWTHGADLILALLAEIAEMEWSDSFKCITRLFASVAIGLKRDKQIDAMWNILRTHCDQTCFCVLESIRLHGCLMITECLRLVNEKVDEKKESQPSEVNDLVSSGSERCENEKIYSFIPNTLVERWAKVLSQRRLDKASSVRAIGVSAVSALPHFTLIDYEGNEFIPNDKVLDSLRDVDAKVREAAIKGLAILSIDHIENTINCLKSEEKPELRRLVAAKLISEVHVMSYTEEQRANLLTFLYKNKDRILHRMARERLIPKWEGEQDGDSTLNSLFNPIDEEPLKIYISALFADDLKKSQSSWDFVEIIIEENPEMICRTNWERSITRLSASELSYGVLLLECTFSVLSEVGELSSCLNRLVPSLSDVCKSMKQISVSWLAGNEADREEEKLMVRILKLIARYDRFDSDGMCAWEDLLRYLILSPEVKPSKILVQLCMDQIIRVFGVDGKMDEIRDWAVDKMDQLLFKEDTATEDDSLKWRCSLILHSLVKCLPTIDSKTADLTSRLMEETCASEWDMQRELNCAIISIVGCLKKDWLEGTMILMLKTSLDIDVDEVKIVCLRGLVDLISIHSPSVMASLLYSEWEEEVISRETKLFQLFDDHVDPTSKSLLSQRAIECCLRLIHEWSPSCPVTIYNLLLFTTRENEGEREALEQTIMEEIKKKMKKSRPFRLLVAHAMYSLIERQKGENAYKCSITSTLMKGIVLLQNSIREEEKEVEEDSIDFEEWLVPVVILDAIIEDPESSMNRALVNSLACMRNGDGGNGLSILVKKMETAIDRLAVYEESSASKSLVKIFEKIDGRQNRKRKVAGEKKGRKRVKKEEEVDMNSDATTHNEEDPF